MMTNREILSTINEKGGGVSFAKGGDVPQSIKHTGASYKYGGKTMTDHEILKHITGGHLAEGYSIREIADIHQVPLSDLKKQVRLGMEAESEHTSSKREQMKIVKDHLFENPEYYTLLKKSGLEDGGGIHSGTLVKDSKSGNTPARDLNNYNDVMDLQADNMVGAETGLFEDGGNVKPYDANMEGDSVDMMFADGGAVSPVVKNWNEVPSIWKDTSKIKKVAFTNSPYDKGLYSIVAPFLGKDDLRPIMSGINFDDNGITVTNAHVLITLPYPSKQFEGVYEADLSKKANPEQITIEGNYPNYSAIIPKMEVTKPFFIDVYKLLQYNNVAMKFVNKYTNAVNYKINDEKVGFNAKFLNESLKTLLKLGHETAYAHYIAPNKALLLSPSKDYEIGNDELILTMPVMVKDYEPLGVRDIDYGRELSVYFDFDDNQIYNADGSIADFKMKYEQNSPIDKDDVNLLQKLANGKQRLEILNSVLVENGLARASDLETEYYLSGVDLPNGIYKPIQGALEITMEAIEDFPTPPIFVTDEDTLQFVISSDILEYYIDKLKYVVGQDDLRPVLQGICLHHTSDNKLFLAGTDAHILLKVNITEYVDMPVHNKEMKFIIQPKRLYDFLNSTENTALTIKSNLVATSIQSDNWSFYARNIDGNYPNYDAVMPKETTNLAVVNLEPIKKAFNTEMVKNYVREASSKDKVFIFNKENEIFIATYTSGDKIEKICETNVDFSLKNYYNENQSVLLFMPFVYGNQTNFAFRKDLVDRVLKIVNDNKLELHYTELNRPYLIPIHSFEYKTTTKEHKVKEQKPSIAEIKLVSTINEVNEIKEAIETLEMLSETATRKDKKEIKEAVEVLQMLLDTYEY
jgi:DNA polymerase III sliding clamp (beta) subunit (PCNA family)